MATIGRADAVLQMPNGIKMTGLFAWLGWIALHIMFLLGSRNRIQTIINLAVRYLGLGRSGVIVGDVAETPKLRAIKRIT
jgi:NADH dehydrogenase